MSTFPLLEALAVQLVSGPKISLTLRGANRLSGLVAARGPTHLVQHHSLFGHSDKWASWLRLHDDNLKQLLTDTQSLTGPLEVPERFLLALALEVKAMVPVPQRCCPELQLSLHCPISFVASFRSYFSCRLDNSSSAVQIRLAWDQYLQLSSHKPYTLDNCRSI